MTIKKNKIGGYYLSYPCPKCEDQLRSPLPEAGTEQTCPLCGAGHTVPGKQEVEEFLRARQKQKEEREPAQEAELQRWQAKQDEQRGERSEVTLRTNLTETATDETLFSYRAILTVTLSIIGLVVFVFSFQNDVTLSHSEVVNLARMQDRLIGCQAGIGLFCAGMILLGLAVLPVAVRKDDGDEKGAAIAARPVGGPDR
jgi:uncharacterized Zn finger protein (UPF0148 family)